MGVARRRVAIGLLAGWLAVGLLLPAAVHAQGVHTPEPSRDLRFIKARYLDLVRHRAVDWEAADVTEMVGRIELQAGKLLNGQVTDRESPWCGSFLKAKQEALYGQALVAARRETERAIRILCTAYWCKSGRFAGSTRLLKGVAMGYRFLNRRQSISQAKSISDIAPAYCHTRENLCRWFAQVGERVPKDVRVDMKDRLRRLLTRKKSYGIDFPLHRLIGAVCLDDERLLQAAAGSMNKAAEKVLSGQRAVQGPNGELDVEKAASTFATLAQYQYLTAGSGPALPDKVTAQVADLLHDILSCTFYRGRADLLAYRSGGKWSGEVERHVAIGAALLVALDPERGAPCRLNYGEVVRRAFGRQPENLAYLDYHALIGQLLAHSPSREEPRITYFADMGYLAVHTPAFYASLRMPLSRGRAAEYARLTATMNFRTPFGDPNLLFGVSAFQPVLQGCTFSQYVVPTGPYCDVKTASGTTCADGARLGTTAAMAGMRMRVRRVDNVLEMNGSWTFLEDKVIVAGTGIAAKSVERKNCAWAACPTDHRQRLTLFFRKTIEFDFVRIYFHVRNGQLCCVPRRIDLMISDDGVYWRRIREIKDDRLPRSGDVPLGGATFRVRKTSTRYLRLYFPLRAQGVTTQIAEVELYNLDAKSDYDDIPSGATNLARQGRAFASSRFNSLTEPQRVNDGDWIATLEPPQTRTCLAMLRTRGQEFVCLRPSGIWKTPFPETVKEYAVRRVQWCHFKQTAYFFLRPADLIVRTVGTGYGAVYIDHTSSDSFAVVIFPDIGVEQATRAAEAGLVKMIHLGESAHIFHDESSGLTAAALFGAAAQKGISSEGPAYVLYREDPGLLTVGKSLRAAPSDVWIEAPDATTLMVNGSRQRIHRRGTRLRVSAHR